MGCNVDCLRHPGQWRAANRRVVINYECGEIHVKKRTTTFSRCFSCCLFEVAVDLPVGRPLSGMGGIAPVQMPAQI